MSAEIQQAALREVHEHGLVGRSDSPPTWNEALTNASPGDPILVRDPDDPRDDFYLVPLKPKHRKARRGAWVMLDPHTLKLREAALLNDWKVPLFPDRNDIENISKTKLTLPDGTQAKVKPKQITPNIKNLIWKPSDASILPYWPLKELHIPHPVTNTQTSVYVTQEGEVFTQFPKNEETLKHQKPHKQPVKHNKKKTEAKTKTFSLKGILTKALLLTLTLTTTTFVLAAKGHPTAQKILNKFDLWERNKSWRIEQLERELDEKERELQKLRRGVKFIK
ncbi:MAG: hypothetical protein AAGC74_10450 [Verrucomicrobiota bacterium]